MEEKINCNFFSPQSSTTQFIFCWENNIQCAVSQIDTFPYFLVVKVLVCLFHLQNFVSFYKRWKVLPQNYTLHKNSQILDTNWQINESANSSAAPCILHSVVFIFLSSSPIAIYFSDLVKGTCHRNDRFTLISSPSLTKNQKKMNESAYCHHSYGSRVGYRVAKI